jgi:hypothetical protein
MLNKEKEKRRIDDVEREAQRALALSEALEEMRESAARKENIDPYNSHDNF